MANLQIIPVGKNVEAQYVEMMVPLYSYGCEKKIKKALANLKGIYSVNVDFPQEKVTVWGICDKYDVVSILKKKRKGARFWDSEEDDIQLQESHSAPPSPPQPSYKVAKSSTRYVAMIKRQSLKLNLSIAKQKLLNWQAFRKTFVRSSSF